MNVLDEIVQRCRERGLSVHRVSPRGVDRLLLEATDHTGGIVAGQWFRDRSRAVQAARRTSQAARPGDVELVPGSGIVLQRRGADRRLPGLRHLLASPGSELVTHRAERRGVVRLPDGNYAKAVAPAKVHALAASLAPAPHDEGIVTPAVLDVDVERGTVTTAALPGRTLEQRLADRDLPDQQVAADVAAVGAALRSFHRRASEVSRPACHDAAAEVDVTRHWLDAVAAWGLEAGDWRPALDAAADGLAGKPEAPTAVHRDLHDKQLLLERDRPVGLLDLDLASVGEPAVDLANLAVHLELRHLQGRCSRARAELCTEALWEGYRPGGPTLERIPAYAASTRLRLMAVYAFRGAPRHLLDGLLASTSAPV